MKKIIFLFILLLFPSLCYAGFSSSGGVGGLVNPVDSLAIFDDTFYLRQGELYWGGTSPRGDAFLNFPNQNSGYVIKKGNTGVSTIAGGAYYQSTWYHIFTLVNFHASNMFSNSPTGGIIFSSTAGLPAHTGDFKFKFYGPQNEFQFRDSTDTIVSKFIADNDNAGLYLARGYPAFFNFNVSSVSLVGTDTSIVCDTILQINGDLYVDKNIIINDSIIGMDATHVDTFMIFDDGDTTRFISDNPIKIGINSLVIDENGNVNMGKNATVEDTLTVNLLQTNKIECNIPYADIFFQDSLITVALTQNVWSQVTNAAGDLFTVSDTARISLVAGDSLYITETGIYNIQSNIIFTGADSVTWNFGVAVNGTIDGFYQPLHTDKDVDGYMQINKIISLMAGDMVTINIRNTTNADDTVIKYGVINIFYISKQ